ncbi:Uma2 family endonuclease [Nocardia otitidiscaviarum]|uniref:Uma2 family endonuclease n=1 Tax=Nocardia otitidiscaviarum TaxID=1823 RepID=UPI00245446DC|nr:Uma2 family endonuclease [Nocardia otitidiscaviarum]
MNVASWPDRLLTLDDWIALPHENNRWYELVEGVLVVSPRPMSRHQRAMWRLAAQLEPQLPTDQGVLTEVELVIEPGTPPTVRVPDVLVIPTSRIAANLPRWEPADVLLTVEILSDGSRRTDRVTKFAEYAEVGIPHYWLIDLDEPSRLTAFQLIGEHYESAGEYSGRATLAVGNSRIMLDLAALTSARPGGAD